MGLFDGPNTYLYAGANPIMFYDPYGLWRFGDPLPQWMVDGAAGFGNTLSFGLTHKINQALGTSGTYNQCSAAYNYGKYAGYGLGGALGGGAALTSKGLSSFAANQFARNPNALRFMPQGLARNMFNRAGWQAGTMRGTTAARGGWSRTYGNGPNYRVQWSAGGGRHGGAYWKVSGSNAGGTHRVRYFFSRNTF